MLHCSLAHAIKDRNFVVFEGLLTCAKELECLTTAIGAYPALGKYPLERSVAGTALNVASDHSWADTRYLTAVFDKCAGNPETIKAVLARTDLLVEALHMNAAPTGLKMILDQLAVVAKTDIRFPHYQLTQRRNGQNKTPLELAGVWNSQRDPTSDESPTKQEDARVKCHLITAFTKALEHSARTRQSLSWNPSNL